MFGFWDGAEQSAMRIDLWTKNMMVDEMGEFFFPDDDDNGRYLSKGYSK